MLTARHRAGVRRRCDAVGRRDTCAVIIFLGIYYEIIPSVGMKQVIIV